MKVLVFGAQCSGKTTLVKYLHSIHSLPLIEIDEEILKLNGGSWPSIGEQKEKDFATLILKNLLAMEEVCFFVNHLTLDQVKQFVNAGFKIIVLEVKESVLYRRNQKRILEEEYDDASKWIRMQLDDIKQLKHHGLIDQIIDGERTTAIVAKDLRSSMLEV